jgi:undecaprenyl-diphosphatase
MDLKSIIDALVLGVVEGVTEFLPVSSTAHLLLVGKLLGFQNPGKAFEVLIQFGAILALLSVYAGRLWHLAATLPRDRRTQHFALGIIIAFLPAAIVGVLLHDYITRVLFESVTLIATTLILGGVVLLFIDRLPVKPRHHEIMDYPLGLCLGIGLFQTLALIPGVSRSGATIVGAMLLGGDKRSAAEFSFFLAMPTMLGAFVYDLYKNIDVIDTSGALTIAIGFVAAFIAAVIVVKTFLGFVSRHGFALFGWWRIVVGIIGLVAVFFFTGAEEAPAVAPEATAVTAPEAAPTAPEASPAAPQPAGDDALGDLIREQGQ